MAQRPFTLSLRALSGQRTRQAQWVCSRCLATQSTPLNAPLQQHASTVNRSIEETLGTPLAHNIPIQHLQHSTSDVLHADEQAQREKAVVHKKIVGVVVSAGRMHKTVKVRVPGQDWNKKIGKHFHRPTNHLVHDPNSSLVAGDVVELHRLRVSTIVHHVVARIITPFGTAIEARPPIPTPDERLAAYKEKRFAKLHRRELRQQAADGDAEAIAELRNMGLDPGKNAAPGMSRAEGLEKGAGQVRTPKKGAVLGNKGQKLLEGVLPGGKHEVGKINERAQKNKSKAMELDAQAEENLLEAKELEEELQTERDLGARTVVPKQSAFEKKVREMPQAGQGRGA